MFFVQETMPQEGSRISAFSQKKMTDDNTQLFNRPATVSCLPLVVCMHSGKHVLIKSFLFYHVANKTELRNLNSYRDLVTFLKQTPKRQEEGLSSMHKFKNLGESSRGKNRPPVPQGSTPRPSDKNPRDCPSLRPKFFDKCDKILSQLLCLTGQLS